MPHRITPKEQRVGAIFNYVSYLVHTMQFGRALQRLLHKIHRANPDFGLTYLSKNDISDGFYRLWLHPEDTIKLAVLFPSRDGEPPLIGIPLTNPMGLKKSPPEFCACNGNSSGSYQHQSRRYHSFPPVLVKSPKRHHRLRHIHHLLITPIARQQIHSENHCDIGIFMSTTFVVLSNEIN